MNKKLFDALKQAYPQLGLSDEILRHHADMLAATITITDENLAAVVAAQGDYLKGLQAENDKRATSAIAKAKAAAEAEKQAAIDEAVKAAVEADRKRANDEAKKKADEEAKRKSERTEPEYLTAFRKELEEKEKLAADREAALGKRIDDLLKVNETQGAALSTLQKENEAMKAKAAKAAREALINNTAKELGIPSWRIDEGFVLADDADESAIKETLGKVANNLKVNTMQGSGGFVLDDSRKVTDEEAAAIADRLMK